MKGDKKEIARIPASALGDLAAWDLPEVSGEHVVALESRKRHGGSPLTERHIREVGIALQRKEAESDVVTVSEAEAIREAAYQDGLLQGLVEGRERGHREGMEKGLAEGQKRGYDEALKRGQSEIAQAVANLAAMVAELHEPVAGQDKHLAEIVKVLVEKLARTVVGAELRVRTDLLDEAIAEALTHLPQGDGVVRVTVAAEDAEHVAKLDALLPFQVDVVSDAAMAPGSFRIKSADTLISSDIQSHFEQVSAQLFSSLTADAAEP